VDPANWLVRANLALLSDLSRSDFDRVASDAVTFVLRARASAPCHVRFGLFVLGTAFTLVRALFLFPAPASSRARTLMTFWSRLPNPAPTLIRFYASLTWLRSTEHPIIVARFGFPDVTARVAEKRAQRARLLGLEEAH
jgi:hypothetical protein